MIFQNWRIQIKRMLKSFYRFAKPSIPRKNATENSTCWGPFAATSTSSPFSRRRRVAVELLQRGIIYISISTQVPSSAHATLLKFHAGPCSIISTWFQIFATVISFPVLKSLPGIVVEDSFDWDHYWSQQLQEHAVKHMASFRVARAWRAYAGPFVRQAPVVKPFCFSTRLRMSQKLAGAVSDTTAETDDGDWVCRPQRDLYHPPNASVRNVYISPRVHELVNRMIWHQFHAISILIIQRKDPRWSNRSFRA